MKSSINDPRRVFSLTRLAGFLIGGAIVCMIALGTHVYVMSALKISAHLLSIRLERAAGCDTDVAGEGVHPVVEAYVHVCIDAPGQTAHGAYVLMLDLEQGLPRVARDD